jgi:acetoin utilization protein AcuB
MTKPIPQIQRYMTTEPLTINSDQNLLEAKNLMKDHDIRHLPVLSAGNLVGVISEKDISAIQGCRGVRLEEERVGYAMTSEPYKVDANTHLNEVCKVMAMDKIGSVLVMSNHKLVGIFTWIDALNAMSELMETRLR